jgi:hypothetical protein
MFNVVGKFGDDLAAHFPGLYISSSRSATRVSSMSLAEPGDRNWQSS